MSRIVPVAYQKLVRVLQREGSTRISSVPSYLQRIRAFVSYCFSLLWSKLRAPLQKDWNAVHPQNNTDKERGHTKDEGTRSVISKPDSPPAPANKKKSRERFRKRLDIARFVIEVLALFGLAVYAMLTYKMWREMQTQTKTAHEQLELSERPWIKIIDVKPMGDFPIVGGLSFQKVGPFKDAPDIRVQATIQFELSFSNVGHSVADVTPSVELFMPPFSISEYWDRVSAEERRFCGSQDMSAVTAQKVTVFPAEPQSSAWHAGISTPVRPENINHAPEGSGIVPALIVCVNYRHKGLPSLYQTRAVYEISHLDTRSRFFEIGDCNLTPFRNTPIIWCKGGIPAKLLKFDRNNMGDDAY